MAADRREQTPRVVRFRPPGVTPLEVWDLLQSGEILWDFMDRATFPLILRRALLDLHAGRAVSRSDGPQRACRDFDLAYLTGGRTACAGLQDALQELPFEVVVSGDGMFCGERGGMQLLHQSGQAAGGMIVDVGQSAIKISLAGRRFLIARDWQNLPLRDDSPCDVAAARTALAEFVADAIRSAIAAIGVKPKCIVLALPCELSDAGVPGGSSYIGMQGYANLPADVSAHAGLANLDILIVNDAELAAHSAAHDPVLAQGVGSLFCRAEPHCLSTSLTPGKKGSRPPRPTFLRTLVVTLGFGVGAALLEWEVR